MPSADRDTVDSAAVPVASAFADDPDVAGLLGFFFEVLDERQAAMLEAQKVGDLEGLKRMSHQTKGSAAGYGFPELTTIASGLEAACEGGDPAEVAGRLAEFVGYLARIDRGV